MTFYKDIGNLYDKSTYYDKYGGSIFITVLVLGIFCYIAFRSYFNNQIISLKQTWDEKKCNPLYMPFAGYVNKEKGKSMFETTSQNFENCTKNLLTGIVGAGLAPANYAAELIVKTVKHLANTINSVRKLMNYMRNNLQKITKQIMNRILNMLVPVTSIIIQIKSLVSKVVGTLTGGIYAAMAALMALKAALGIFVTKVVLALVIFATVIAIMWIMPWTWPIAGVMTTFFFLISIPTTIMLYWLSRITGYGTSASMPANPCFDENTLIKMKNGEKYIKNIQINDELLDGSIVTAIIKSSIKGGQMYKLHNILVTGLHYVHHKDHGWIKVCDHPDSQKIWLYEKSHVFCLNTSSKKIRINNDVFLDWDDITDEDIENLQKGMNIDDFHKVLDGYKNITF